MSGKFLEESEKTRKEHQCYPPGWGSYPPYTHTDDYGKHWVCGCGKLWYATRHRWRKSYSFIKKLGLWKSRRLARLASPQPERPATLTSGR